MPLTSIFLQAGQDKRVVQGHPWAYSNEIRMDDAAKAVPPGTCVCLRRVDGKPLGIGTFNPHSLIAFRLLDANSETPIDQPFLEARLRRALALRGRLFDRPFYRLVHAEGDSLPGLICDRYGDVVVLQVNTAGMDRLGEPLLAAVDSVLAPTAIVLRNDQRVRSLEGLERTVSIAKGAVVGPVEVEEAGLRFYADVISGQKTGWFYDQRRNRLAVAPLAAGGAVLDLYCHSGGFAMQSLARGALRARAVDSADKALALANEAAARHGVTDRITFDHGDVFDVLEAIADGRERFRLVVADPPAFAKSKRDVVTALRGYRKLARLAASAVEPGGFLFLASCSHAVDAPAFLRESVRGVDQTGRKARLIREAGAGPDHPMHPRLPETAYLKSLLFALD